MSVETVVTEGFGSFGDVAHVVTDGFGIGLAPSTPADATILTQAFGALTAASAFVVTEGFRSGTPTPTPTPTGQESTPLQGAGNPAGPGKPHTTGNSYTDIARWTRRGTAVRVKAEAVQTRRPWLHTYAEIRQLYEKLMARAEPQLARPAAPNLTASLYVHAQRLRAMAGTDTRRMSAANAIGRQSERQDVADILAIIDMLEELDDEE